MKVKALVSKIDWDTDGEVIDSLPKDVTLELEVDERDNPDEEVVNKLIDDYCFWVNSFSVCYLDEDGNDVEFPDEFGEYVNYAEAKVS